MADNYGDADGYVAYHSARNNDTALAFDEIDIAGALIVATEWLDGKYRSSYPGRKVGYRAQVREWPRDGAYDVNRNYIDPNAVPVEIINATYEAAAQHMMNPGALSLNWTPSKYKRVSIDGALSVDYAQYGGTSEIQTQFAVIEFIMAGILNAQSEASPLSGASFRA